MRASIVGALRDPRVRWTLLVVGGLLALAFVGLLVFQILPDLFAPDRARGFGIAAEAKARADVRTSALQLIGGLVIAIGAVLTARNVQLTQERNRIERESQLTERFTRAIDQLGSGELDIRLGGVYALERIARDSPADHWTIMEVLTAFVREHAPCPVEVPSQPSDGRPPAPATDVQAVLTVLGRRDGRHDGERQLDLNRIDVRGAELADARLRGVQLRDARLERAGFVRADLSAANLWGTHLEDARLSSAYLDDVFAYEAHFAHARMKGTSLRRAWLMGADLRHAVLEGANLRGASLVFAQLDGIHLEGASFDANTRWPDGFDPLEHGAERQDD